jgi:hypothetical protein
MSWRETAERILREVCDKPVRQYSMRDFGREQYPDAVSVILPREGYSPSREAYRCLVEVRQKLPPELVAFLGTTSWLGDERHDGIELVIGPGESQFDILVIAASNAVNYAKETGDLIKKFQAYDRLCGIDILQAETDTVVIQLKGIPADVKAFAEDVYAFCPDIVDQGVGTVERLQDLVETTGLLTFWWD